MRRDTDGRRWFLVVVIACAIVVMTATLFRGKGHTTKAPPPVVLQARVNPRGSSTPIARHFVGLSLEYLYVTGSMGTAAGPNPIFARLLDNLAAAGNGAPMLRIGGGTADSAWWNPRGFKQPDGVTFDITPQLVGALRDFQRATHAPLIIDLNLAANRPSIATAWARAAWRALGSRAIAAFEIGNEPDIYPQRKLGSSTARPAGWGLPEYLREFSRFAAALKRAVPGATLAGPSACCHLFAVPGLVRFMKAERGRVPLVTYHSYIRCSRDPIPVGELLSERTLRTGIGRLQPLVASALRLGDRFRLTETDPSYCSGDSRFAAALWATDWLYSLAALGVSGADFHQIGMSPFNIFQKDGRSGGAVSPLYYGVLLALKGMGHGARLLPQTTLSERVKPGANVRLWATIDRRGTVRATAINKQATAGGVVMRLSGAYANGMLERLLAPSPTATEGVRLAGRQVAFPTTTGALQGDRKVELIRPRRGVYRFNLPAMSAAMLTIGHGRGG